MNYSGKSFKQNPDFVSREVAGEYILVPTGKAAVEFNGLASLNETGRFIWTYLNETHTFSEICDVFSKEYELTDDQACEDVTEYLTLALSHNLIVSC